MSFGKQHNQLTHLSNHSSDNEEFWNDVSNTSFDKISSNKLTSKAHEINDMSFNFNTPCFINNDNDSIRGLKRNENDIQVNLYKANDYITFENKQYTNQANIVNKAKKNNSQKRDFTLKEIKVIDQRRQEKFNLLLNKYGREFNDHHITSKRNNKTSRIEKLYDHGKIKQDFLAKIRNYDLNQKQRQEEYQCTFYPKINKRSRSLANSMNTTEGGEQSIYDRNILWANNRNEMIQKEKKKKMMIDNEKNLYMPIPSKYQKEFSSKQSLSTNTSTLLYFERQEKARKIKKNNSSIITQSKYNSCFTDLGKNYIITKSFLSQWKAALHDELLFTRDNDEI